MHTNLKTRAPAECDTNVYHWYYSLLRMSEQTTKAAMAVWAMLHYVNWLLAAGEIIVLERMGKGQGIPPKSL